MTPEIKKGGRHGFGHKGQGPTSFWMQSPEPLFDGLDIMPGQNILDLGCGAGEYTLEAARRTGTGGCVSAIDHWPPIVDGIKEAASAAGLPQIRPMTGDILNPPLPLKDNTIDLCMVFTVLHIFDLSCCKDKVFGELARIITPGGCLAILECKKEEWSFGPPVHMRLAPQEIEDYIEGWGFTKKDYKDLGFNYLLKFTLE
ncbi:MAG: class I SAM-dependent methyltransferase [Desulfobacter sp.]|nr:class I SAM-dependent methyltransferase [Desulfobacter sp.]WDP88121.1 MAG: class I SAM-dependent methyltransferase [Desulfobacter sp.]